MLDLLDLDTGTGAAALLSQSSNAMSSICKAVATKLDTRCEKHVQVQAYLRAGKATRSTFPQVSSRDYCTDSQHVRAFKPTSIDLLYTIDCRVWRWGVASPYGREALTAFVIRAVRGSKRGTGLICRYHSVHTLLKLTPRRVTPCQRSSVLTAPGPHCRSDNGVVGAA